MVTFTVPYAHICTRELLRIFFYQLIKHSAGNFGGSNTGGNDAFFAKYDSTGVQQWIKKLDTSSDDYVEAIAVDSSDNLYVGGHTYGAFTGINAGGLDAFFAKYDSTGETQEWIVQLGTTNDDRLDAMAVDSNDNLLVGGRTGWIARYSSSGSAKFYLQLGTGSLEAIAVDASDNIFAGGYTE